MGDGAGGNEPSGTGTSLPSLPQIQVLRALAAISVLIYHLTWFTRNVFYKLPEEAYECFYYGVHLFFAISGFVLWNTQEGTLRFLLRRVVRIYPAYFLALAVNALLRPGTCGDSAFCASLPALLLMPHGGDSSYALMVEWTLLYEVAFYLLLAVMLFLPDKLRNILPCMWLAVLVLAGVGSYGSSASFHARKLEAMAPTWNSVYISSFCLPFVLGILARQICHIRISPIIMAAIVLASAWGAVVCGGDFVVANGLAGGVSAVLVLLFCQMPWRDTLITRWLVRLGDWSYGIYLLHVTVLIVSIKVLVHWGVVNPPLLTEILLGAVVLFLAAVFGRVEWAMQGRIKRLCFGRPNAFPKRGLPGEENPQRPDAA